MLHHTWIVKWFNNYERIILKSCIFFFMLGVERVGEKWKQNMGQSGQKRNGLFEALVLWAVLVS